MVGDESQGVEEASQQHSKLNVAAKSLPVFFQLSTHTIL